MGDTRPGDPNPEGDLRLDSQKGERQGAVPGPRKWERTTVATGSAPQLATYSNDGWAWYGQAGRAFPEADQRLTAGGGRGDGAGSTEVGVHEGSNGYQPRSEHPRTDEPDLATPGEPVLPRRRPMAGPPEGRRGAVPEPRMWKCTTAVTGVSPDLTDDSHPKPRHGGGTGPMSKSPGGGEPHGTRQLGIPAGPV